MNVIVLHGNHRKVSTSHVVIFRMTSRIQIQLRVETLQLKIIWLIKYTNYCKHNFITVVLHYKFIRILLITENSTGICLTWKLYDFELWSDFHRL